MELHKKVKPENKYDISMNDDYLIYFSKAKRFVEDNYHETYNTIANTKFDDITPEFFYRELCWVIGASGFNARVVSGFFLKLMDILYPVLKNERSDLDAIKAQALRLFNNKRKIIAMIESGQMIKDGIKEKGWIRFKNEELNTPKKLMKFPYIGPITVNHICRNIGIDAVKPDRHLTRMAQYWGFDSPLALCEKIKEMHNIPVGMVDYILFMSLSTWGSK